MKHRNLLYFAFALFLGSCNEKDDNVVINPPRVKGITDSLKKVSDNPLGEFDSLYIKEKKALENGMFIEWVISAPKENPTLKDGEVCMIDYRLSLPDGKIIDGNSRLKLPFIPFMVGYNMQIPGWDIGLKSLRVGDFAKIVIPASKAYGKQGLNKIVPPDSPVWLYVKVITKVSPDYDSDGMKTWVFDKGQPSDLDEVLDKEILYHCIASSKSNPNVQNSLKKGHPFTYMPGELNVVPGLRNLLSKARKNQKIFALLSPKQAYGEGGLGNIVQPNESVFFNITIASVRKL
jgi:FKBP-type peptidyl-prolyl cis-trans isomerase